MMARSSSDPYWQAKVRFESSQTPAAAAIIEDKCLSCHVPMQHYPLRVSDAEMRFDDFNDVGLEGVSCTTCHQIIGENLGTHQSFTGGFEISSEGLIFGPHADPFPMPMLHHTGFTPAEGPHILESSLCGTCHTVITPTLDERGRIRGEFLEQAPYLEWLASSLPAEGRSCQSCHLPVLRDPSGRPAPQFIAHTPGGGFFGPTRPRMPFGQHFLAGANTQVLKMIRELFPHESRALSTTEAETQRMLNSAVKLRVSSRVTGAALEAEVQLVNHTGHKLPTAYPSRRMWLHLVLYDAKGVAVFESGSADPRTGEIVGLGEAGAPDFEPHFDVIASPGQVAVYEAELKDSSGNFTASLVRAAGYLKDNRILPRGFSRERSMLEGIDPGSLTSVGVEQDPNFGPGSDKVFYQMDLSDAGGPFRLIVEVYYQGIKPKHLKGMDKSNSGEEASLLDLFTRHRGPSLMARQELVIDQ